MFPNLDQLLRGYEFHEVLVEVAVIWLCVYLIIRFLRGTRGAGIIKGVAVLLVVLTLLIRVLTQETGAFSQLNFIYDRFLGVLTVVLIVVFQPELRQAMIRLGQARWFRGTSSKYSPVIEAISDAVDLLSKSQFGALIAIERTVKLGGLIAGGEEMDAKVSARLLSTIFWPNSPLHDLGVVIREDRIMAANVQFPLAEDVMLPSTYGSRHRAALGLTLESDCIVVVVSEETGRISIAQNGQLTPDIPRKLFRDELAARLRSDMEQSFTDAQDASDANASSTSAVTTSDEQESTSDSRNNTASKDSSTENHQGSGKSRRSVTSKFADDEKDDQQSARVTKEASKS